MKLSTMLVFSVFVFTVVSAAAAQSPEEAKAIKAAALDYGEGWYEGNAERMERALHPELAKRMVFTNPRNGRGRLSQQSAMTLVQNTRRGGGKNAPVEKKESEAIILDVFENAAVVKVVGPEWVDYLHMAKWKGRWVIVNVLWELNPKTRERWNRRAGRR